MDTSTDVTASQSPAGAAGTVDKIGLTARTTSMANNSSANSIASDFNLDGSNSMRSSIDGALDRRTGKGSEDGYSEAGSTRRRMSKLFKGRRRRRKSTAQDDRSIDDRSVGEASLIGEAAPPLPDPRPLLKQYQSEESLGLHKSVASSLMTEDSDTETSQARPSISPHQSHAGYLTLSSPLITSETVDSLAASASAADSAASAQGSGLKHAHTLDVGASIKRSPSPIGKLKEAFVPTRRAATSKTLPDQEPKRPNTSGGGLGTLFGGAGKNSGSRGGPKGLEEPAPAHTSPRIHNSEETQSSSSLPSLGPKRIITTIPATPPNLVETPTTLVTPPTPTDAKPPSPATPNSNSKVPAKHNSTQSNPNIVTSPSGSMISHRRARSATNPPSKLSNSISAPLSPTAEETRTPGGTLIPQTPGGFFSSVFSAAQNAANTLSSTIANTTSNSKGKGNSSQISSEESKTGGTGDEEVIGPETADLSTENSGTEKKRLAVETLGSGDLSLAHLGISDSVDPSPMSSVTNLEPVTDQASARAEDIAAAQAVSAAYAEETAANPQSVGRSRSTTNPSDIAAPSPRRLAETDSPSNSIQRTGSIRSRISGGRKRRHRGSSATTGHTIAAAINASTSTLAPQLTQNNGGRLNGTGFAVAAPKRNRDFHNLFKSVPEDDYLIEDYSAALQKEILLHGRLYVSEGHLCFSSNILGWVTNLVISFDEVVSVEKKSTAVVFPNAIVIQTLHARNVFASFLSRDSTYDLIIGIWKISHPNLKSSLNGVTLDGAGGTGDKTEKANSVSSDGESSVDSDDEVYDEDAEEEEGIGSFTEGNEGSIAGSEQESVKVEARKASATVAAAVGGGAPKLAEIAEAVMNGAASSQDFPGPATHAPTDCGDADAHYDKLLIDTVIPAPLGKIYSLMFGPASGAFMRKWLIDDQKSSDLQMEDDKKGLGEDRKTFSFSYIKPLGGGIGPKQTKCNISMTLEQFDLERVVTVLCSTQTPDVPSGNVFLTKTRYCLSWAPNNSTRLLMTFVVEWSGKSWLKGPIEKGANDGQVSYANSLTAALKAAISAKVVRPTKGGKGKKRGKAQASEESVPVSTGTNGATDGVAQVKTKNWGLLEPLRDILGPVADILETVISKEVIMTILLITVLWLYFFRSPHPVGLQSSNSLSLSTPQRLVAYEEIWRAEENELWDWLDERVSLDRTTGFAKEREAVLRRQRQKREMGERLEDEAQGRMSEREIDEAIRVTEERLEAMKSAVSQRRRSGSSSAGAAPGEGQNV